jgi:hypothetical protein
MYINPSQSHDPQIWVERQTDFRLAIYTNRPTRRPYLILWNNRYGQHNLYLIQVQYIIIQIYRVSGLGVYKNTCLCFST